MAVSFRVEDSGVIRTVGRLGQSTAKAVAGVLAKGARQFQREYTKAKLSRPRGAGGAFQGGASGGGTQNRKWLYRRSGSLAKAFTYRVTKGSSLANTSVRIGWIDRHAAMIATVHERGAIIRPRKSKYLTIPLPAAMTAAGVPRETSARNWANTFVKNAIIFQKLGGGRVQPLYVLKRQVRIPARLEFIKTAEAFWIKGAGAQLLDEAMRELGERP